MSAIPVINHLNSQFSTGPRTPEGKQRSSRNALRHGLTAASPVLPTEDRAAYESHRRAFLDEYQPATPTETQLVDELADTSWRLRRIPLLEARLISGFDSLPIVEAHRLLASLSLQSTRLSGQFQKALLTLRKIQADRRQIKEAATQIPSDPPTDGFVFSQQKTERCGARTRACRVDTHVDTVAVPPPSQGCHQPDLPPETVMRSTNF